MLPQHRNNQHYALNFTIPLFNILAPTCFGSSLPSTGSFLDPSELLEMCRGMQQVASLDTFHTGHTGQTVIHIDPQHRYYLSSFWGTTIPWWWQWIAETCWGKIWNVPTIQLLRLICWLLHNETTIMLGPAIKN
jgi:hypothetical protein